MYRPWITSRGPTAGTIGIRKMPPGQGTRANNAEFGIDRSKEDTFAIGKESFQHVRYGFFALDDKGRQHAETAQHYHARS